MIKKKMSLFNVDDLQLEYGEQSKEPCKGLFWRGHITSEYEDGVIRTSKSLVLIPEKSCHGCEHCDWIHDYLLEDIKCYKYDDVLDGLVDGHVYKIALDFGYDFDSGFPELDGWDLKEIDVGEL